MKARIVELAGKGLTDEQIAERLGCTPRHVAKVRQAAGIPAQRRSLACKVAMPVIRDRCGRFAS